jgi:hypothetical protein
VSEGPSGQLCGVRLDANHLLIAAVVVLAVAGVAFAVALNPLLGWITGLAVLLEAFRRNRERTRASDAQHVAGRRSRPRS